MRERSSFGGLSSLENDRIRNIFTIQELSELEQMVKEKLVPDLENVRFNIASTFSLEEDSPDDHISSYKDVLDVLKKIFPSDAYVQEAVEKELKVVKEWIEENEAERDAPSPRDIGQVKEAEDFFSSRSIFDDIDEF